MGHTQILQTGMLGGDSGGGTHTQMFDRPGRCNSGLCHTNSVTHTHTPDTTDSDLAFTAKANSLPESERDRENVTRRRCLSVRHR